MPRTIALLRAINVGKQNRLPMADLRKLVTELGFTEVSTYLQSGNLVFETKDRDLASVEDQLASELERVLSLKVDFVARTHGDWVRVIEQNPFLEEAKSDPSHLVVTFLKDAASNENLERLRSSIKGRETVELRGKHLYAYYPDGIGESKLTINVIEGKLNTRCTARNWNTVLKLAELAS